jgi:hypothetical protein
MRCDALESAIIRLATVEQHDEALKVEWPDVTQPLGR